MTEIQWLCSLLLECKLPKDVKDRFIARIGEVEKNLANQPQMASRPIQPLIMPPSSRMPDPAQDLNQSPPVARPQIRSQPIEIDKSTGRAMVNNGDGTRGPRKF